MATNAETAGVFPLNAAAYFRTIAGANPSAKKEMEATARSYEIMADLVVNDPTGASPPPPAVEG